MMSSEEVRDIMNMYSNSIENCQNEIEYYSKRVAELTKNRDRIADHNAKMQKEQEDMAEEILKNTEEIEELTTQLNDVQEKYNEAHNSEDVSRARSLIENIRSCSEKWDIGDEGEERRRAIQKFEEIIDALEKDRDTIAKLEEENFRLKEDEVLKDYQEKLCITCKQM